MFRKKLIEGAVKRRNKDKKNRYYASILVGKEPVRGVAPMNLRNYGRYVSSQRGKRTVEQQIKDRVDAQASPTARAKRAAMRRLNNSVDLRGRVLNELSNALLRRYQRKAQKTRAEHEAKADFHGRRSMDHLFKSVTHPEYKSRHERASDAHNAESLKQRKKAEKRTRGLANAKTALAKQLKTRLTAKGSLGTRRKKSAQRLNNSFDPRELMFRQLLEGEVKRRNKKEKRTWEELSGRLHKAFVDPQLQSKKEYERYQDDHYDEYEEKRPTGRGDAPRMYKNTGDSLKHNKNRFTGWGLGHKRSTVKAKAREKLEASRQSPRPVLPGSPDYAQRAKESMAKRLKTIHYASGYRPGKYASSAFRKKLNDSIDFSNDIRQLFSENADLSEEFMTNAAALFETAVNNKVEQLRESIEIDAAETTAAFIENYCNDLVENVDQYLTYVSTQLLEQHSAEIAENAEADKIMQSMAEEINMLSEQAEIVAQEAASMQNETDELQNVISEQSQTIERLVHALEEAHRKNIVLEASFDLTVSDTEKLLALVEEIDFEDAQSFTERVHIIKQRVFAVRPSDEKQFDSPIDEAQPLAEEFSPAIEAYAKMLSR